jgi:hypothetical protein
MPFSDYNNLLIAFRSWKNTYLRSGHNDEKKVTQSTDLENDEKWTVLAQSDGSFAFKSSHNWYLRADDNTNKGINQGKSLEGWEKWTVEEQSK